MYDFRFYQACMGQTRLVYKVGCVYVGVYRVYIGENLRRAKGVDFFLFIYFFFHTNFFNKNYGVSIGIRSG
jgi:hypothetical protein